MKKSKNAFKDFWNQEISPSECYKIKAGRNATEVVNDSPSIIINDIVEGKKGGILLYTPIKKFESTDLIAKLFSEDLLLNS